MATTDNIEETLGFEIAIAFKPFIDSKCTEHIEIVKDMARAINRHIDALKSPELREQNDHLKSIIEKIKAFEAGDTVQMGGLTFRRGINENSFYNSIKV